MGSAAACQRLTGRSPRTLSYKVLTETLRRAERDGLISRRLDEGRIETATLYELTDLGRSLDQPLAALAEWAEGNWKAVEVAGEQWDVRRQAGAEGGLLPLGAVCLHTFGYVGTR